MNIRQEKYKKNRLKGMSAYQAAIKAGYRHATAWNAHKNIEKRCNLQQILVAKGITDDKIAQVAIDGLNANRVISAVNTGREANGGDTDFIEVPDHNIRHKFMETCLKLSGKLKDSVQTAIQVVNMNQITVNGKAKEFDVG